MHSKLEVYRQAICKYGIDSQIGMAQGECGELIAALVRYSVQGRDNAEEVIEEIADVSIILDQLKLIFGENECKDAKLKKLKRLEKRLKDV